MLYLNKDQVKKIILNAPTGTTPEGIVAGLRQKGYALEGYDETFNQREEPDLLDKISNVVEKGYEKFKNIPVIKQAGQVVGGAVGALGALETGIAYGAGESFLQSKNLLRGKGYDVKKILKSQIEGVKIGYKEWSGIGKEAVPIAISGWGGKLIQGALAIPMLNEAKKDLKNYVETGDNTSYAKGIANLSVGTLGLKHSTGRAWGDIKTGLKIASVSETPIRTGIKETTKELTKNLLLEESTKARLGTEYRYLRYGKEGAPVVNSKVISLLDSALKPPKRMQANWSKDLNVVANELANKNINNIDIVSFKNLVNEGKAQIWSDVKSALKKGEDVNLKIDGDEIASEIRSLKNDPKLQIENAKYVRNAETGEVELVETGALRRLEEKARAYDGKSIDFLDAEAILEKTNAETSAYYKKTGVGKALAEKADVELAAELKLADVVRKQQDDLLTKIEQEGFAGLKRKYGSFRNVGEVLNDKIFTEARLNLSSLGETIAGGRQAAMTLYGLLTGNTAAAASGIADKMLTSYLKNLDKSSSKINRAFKIIQNNFKLNQGKSVLEPLMTKIKPGFTIEDVSKNKADDLLAEAKRYKSAEEMIKVFNEVGDKAGSAKYELLSKNSIKTREVLMSYLQSLEVEKMYQKGLRDNEILSNIWNKANKADDITSSISKAKASGQSFEVRDKTGLKLQDPYTAEYLPLNLDGTITVYHSTTKGAAEKIKQSGLTGSKTEGGDIYFTTNKKGYGGIGKDKDTVLAFNVDPKKIKFDDIYRGELHLKGNNADIGGIKPITSQAKTDNLTTSIKSAKQSGQSFDEWVKGQTTVYHGTSAKLKQFNNKQGTFFTDDMMNAEGYAGGENVYEGYLDLKKPLIIDAKGRLYNDLKTEYGKSTNEIVGKIDKKKYDGVIFKNIKDSWVDDADAQDPTTIYYAFKPRDAFKNVDTLKAEWDKGVLGKGVVKEKRPISSVDVHSEFYLENAKKKLEEKGNKILRTKKVKLKSGDVFRIEYQPN